MRFPQAATFAIALAFNFSYLEKANSMWGGRLARAGEFSTLAFWVESETSAGIVMESCSGVMVAPSILLTAAHCMYTGKVLHAPGTVMHISDNTQKFQMNYEVQFPKGLTLATTPRDQLKIVGAHMNSTGANPRILKVNIAPSYLKRMDEPGGESELGTFEASDVALVELDRSLGYTVMPIDVRPLQAGQPVIVGGFGMRGSKGQSQGVVVSGTPILRVAVPKVNELTERYAVIRNFFYYLPTSARLDNGDSGSPMYSTNDDGSLSVRGVLSMSSFKDGMRPHRSSFTRFDTSEVAGWLESFKALDLVDR